jgi:hypothetical protein
LTAAKTVGKVGSGLVKATSGLAESVIPAAAEVKLLTGINDVIQNGAQPLLEKRILKLQNQLSKRLEDIPSLQLTESQGLSDVNEITKKIAESQNRLQSYISLSNFTQNASADAIKAIGSTLTAAGIGGVVGGTLGATTSEKPGDKTAALAGFGAGAATGGVAKAIPETVNAVKNSAEIINSTGQLIRGAVSTRLFEPGESINVSDLYNNAADIVTGKKPAPVPEVKPGEVAFVADSSKKIMKKAPTMEQVTDLLTNAVVDPDINRLDPRYVTLVSRQGRVMGEISKERRGARPLETFEGNQPNANRLPEDRVLSYSYSPEHKMIYAEFVPTKQESVGGQGISNYFYDNINPELAAEFLAAKDKTHFIRTRIETDRNIDAIATASNKKDLQQAVELYRSGKLQFEPTGKAPTASKANPEVAPASQTTSPTPATPAVTGSAKQTSKQVSRMFKEAEAKIKESIPASREDFMVDLRAMNDRMERQRGIEIENETIAAGKKQKADEAIAAEKKATEEAASKVEKSKLGSIEKQNQGIIDQIVEKEGVDYQDVVKARKGKTDQEYNQYLSERLGQADVVAARKAMLGEEQAKKSEIPRSFTTEEFNKRKVNALNEFKERNIPLNSDTEIAARVLAGTKDPRQYNLLLKNVTDLFTEPAKTTAKPKSLKGFGELETGKFGPTP